MRSRRRSEAAGWRVLVLLVLSFLAIYVGLDIYEAFFGGEVPASPFGTSPFGTSLEDAFAHLHRANERRWQARDEAFRVLQRECAKRSKPARDLIELLNELRVYFDPRSKEAHECSRLEFGQCVRLLREGHEKEALSRIWHLGNPDGIAPDYDHVWIHLQSDRYEEAANVAAEALAAREKAGVPDLAAHLEFYAWLLGNAGRLVDEKAVEERLSRLAVDPPPPREPEREEQAADDTRPR
ncbi:MAG: hypothetical protein ACYTDU_07120 [Planctomycetota bacterium]